MGCPRSGREHLYLDLAYTAAPPRNRIRHHDHGPGLKTFTEPTCLAKPWAAAWELYVAHAVKQGYAKHLVPRPCAEEPSGSCLPAACAE